MVFRRSALALAGLLTVLPALAADTLPAPIAAVEARGLTIVGSFEAPAGLKGYAGQIQGQPVALYLTADGQHVLVGTLLDAKGQDLTSAPLDKLVNGPRNQAAWQTLGESAWVVDGNPKAPRIIYVFTDPECPYCHRFWQQARPWVEAGKVQLRHVMVGIIREESPDESAAVLAAADPAKALDAHQHGYRQPGYAMDTSGITEAARQQVEANNDMMTELGIHATPAIYYQEADGTVRTVMGLPQGDKVEEVMGSPKP
ncbi:thiol:disulfide interchange protein DsbG [Gallaecimonas xiamenensis]|uniref:Thiol:disulfide interchange protein n=1 Tax=Gallaecimonas xiamenensis 3-C-1 TaxID=745411 RepID=K2JA25_9GAMM|nr:thiol:disulfide interchange protein DsbG [Gallaecimonas xiamenensis]EKE71647.1 disulfide isomerase/thiol-disulfide oxidase [Gallaecimonas xiamenensis 3-C-1]